MRLSEREFWGLTLAQFNSLVKWYAAEQETLNYRGALICSVIAEVNRDRKKQKKPFTPEDFMPKRRKGKLTGEQMMDQVKAANIVLGGEVK